MINWRGMYNTSATTTKKEKSTPSAYVDVYEEIILVSTSWIFNFSEMGLNPEIHKASRIIINKWL